MSVDTISVNYGVGVGAVIRVLDVHAEQIGRIVLDIIRIEVGKGDEVLLLVVIIGDVSKNSFINVALHVLPVEGVNDRVVEGRDLQALQFAVDGGELISICNSTSVEGVPQHLSRVVTRDRCERIDVLDVFEEAGVVSSDVDVGGPFVAFKAFVRHHTSCDEEHLAAWVP